MSSSCGSMRGIGNHTRGGQRVRTTRSGPGCSKLLKASAMSDGHESKSPVTEKEGCSACFR